MKQELFYYIGRQDILPGPTQALMLWAMGAMWEQGRCDEGVTLGELHNIITQGSYTPHPLSINMHQLFSAIKQAKKDGYIMTTHNKTMHKIHLRLTEKACNEVSIAAKEAEEVSAQALEEWRRALIAILGENDLSAHNVAELWRLIVDAMPKVVGYIEGSFSGNDYYVNIEGWLEDVVGDGRYDKVYTTALRLFITIAVNDREAACRKLFNIIMLNALYGYRTTIPAEVEARIKSEFKRRVLFLDTNILYALVGATGDEVWEEAVRGFAKAAKTLGFQLKYTRRTAQEYSETVKNVVNDLSQPSPSGPVERSSWSHLAPSLERAFYQANLDSVHFMARYQDPERALRDYCNVVSVERDQFYDENFLNRIEGLSNGRYNFNYKMIQERPRKSRKPHIVIAHDAAMVTLVELLNSNTDQFLFITADNALLRLKSQYVLGIDQWFSLFGPALSSVGDYTKYLFDVIARTRFPSFYIHPELASAFAKFISRSTTSNDRETIEAHLMYTHRSLGHYIDNEKHSSVANTTPIEYSPEDYERAIRKAKSEMSEWDKKREIARERAKSEKRTQVIKQLATSLAEKREIEKGLLEDRGKTISKYKASIIDAERILASKVTMLYIIRIVTIIAMVLAMYYIYNKYKNNQNILSAIPIVLTSIAAVSGAIERVFSARVSHLQLHKEQLMEETEATIGTIEKKIKEIQNEINNISNKLRET